IVADACTDAGVPWGHVSSGCIYTGARPDGSGFTETDTPNFSFRTNNCSFYSGTKALGEEVLAGKPSLYVWRLRIPFNNIDGPRNYLTKLLRYQRLLEATNSISQLEEFVAATFACWEKRVPFGLYNVTNPGQVTTHEVVDLIKQSGVSNKEFVFFKDEADFMHTAAKTPRSNCVMDSTKLAKAGIQMTEVHEAVARDLKNWKKAD
ncbi:MAG: sugar nucleotide-binding protein, partial [Verrucomicrobiota bacterium]